MRSLNCEHLLRQKNYGRTLEELQKSCETISNQSHSLLLRSNSRHPLMSNRDEAPDHRFLVSFGGTRQLPSVPKKKKKNKKMKEEKKEKKEEKMEEKNEEKTKEEKEDSRCPRTKFSRLSLVRSEERSFSRASPRSCSCCRSFSRREATSCFRGSTPSPFSTCCSGHKKNQSITQL